MYYRIYASLLSSKSYTTNINLTELWLVILRFPSLLLALLSSKNWEFLFLNIIYSYIISKLNSIAYIDFLVLFQNLRENWKKKEVETAWLRDFLWPAISWYSNHTSLLLCAHTETHTYAKGRALLTAQLTQTLRLNCDLGILFVL